MGKVTQFNPAPEKGSAISNLTMPTKEEIAILDRLTEQHEGNDMVDIAHWNGECWRMFFELVDLHAEVNNLDKWGCRAVILTKILGTTFEYDENGNVTVITGPANAEKR